jgi:pilus assembly protein CpaB
MNRQIRTLVVLLVAVVVAGVASYGVYRAMATIQARRAEIKTGYAVVAARAMPVGSLVTIDDVKLVKWPADAQLGGGFSDLQVVVDRGLIAAVAENEPLTESKLAPKGAGAGLTPTITPGMRAMSVKVNEVIGVAGFVVPGTRVDVLTIIQRDKDERMARTVVSNIQVLTAGTRYDQEEAKKDGKAIRSTVVTLMVTPEDAERISLAQAEGQLMLALRNPLDTDPSETKGVRMAGLFGDAPPPAPAAQPSGAPRRSPVVRAAAPGAVVAPPAPVIYRVEAIRAAKRTEEVVNP